MGPDFQDEYFTTRGSDPVELHYVQADDARHDVIVFLHGFPQFSYMWKQHMQMLKSEHFVVAPDLRGYGASEKPLGIDHYKIELLVEDVKQLIEKVGPQGVTLVAHDWGGLVAQALAIEHPTLVRYLVIINSPHPKLLEERLVASEPQRRGLDYIITLRGIGVELGLSLNPTPLEQALYYNDPNSKVFSAEDREIYRSQWTYWSLRGALNYYRAAELGPPDYWTKFNGGVAKFPIQSNYLPGKDSYELKMPVLYIWGDKDQHLFPELMEGIEKYAPLATTVHLPEGSHWTPNEFPREVVEHIQRFIK